MDAKFRALTLNDAVKLGNIVKSNTEVDGYDILDVNTYGEFDNAGVERLLTSMHTRKVIKLTAPTFNNVLGRSGCNLLRKVLGLDSRTWTGITNMELVMEKSSGKYIPIDEAASGTAYYYGAEIAEHLIDMFDIEQAKLKALYSALGAVSLRLGVPPKDAYLVDRNKNAGVPLVDGYYAHYDKDKIKPLLKRKYNLDNLSKDFANCIFANNESRYTYLVNMSQDKRGMYGMLNYHIMVLPLDMRPELDKREHKLTKRYTSVLKANYELHMCPANAAPKVRQSRYLALERATSKLQYKMQGTAVNVKADDLAILERIKSKKGQIRMRNLGKRQDYSGRAVVCINPFLPLDVIRVPKSMLPKLLQYHVLPYLAENIRKNNKQLESGESSVNVYSRLKLTNLDTPEAQEEIIRIINEEKILDKVPMVLGRQPTLHKQSLQGFHVEMTDLQAIEVNPLVCPAFNMDFDGDQGHLEVPLSSNAIKEVNDLVITTQNLFLPKTGECTTEPRQDMLYGLWLCTNNDYKLGTPVGEVYTDLKEVRDAVINHRVKVWDTVRILNPSLTILAGDAAFMSCFPKDSIAPRGTGVGTGKIAVQQIDKHTITDYIDYLLRTDVTGRMSYFIGTKYASTETFVGAINALVELGFKVARLYPPNMSLLVEKPSLPTYDNAIDVFHSDMEEIDFLYNLGLETSDNYKIAFDKHLEVLKKSKADVIMTKLGADNGYVKLSQSGARGSKDNLIQAFAYKGRVKKNSNESFDALIENCYASQLTPMEHFVAAFGGRQGQIDKSLKTGDTGYAMRKMWHATQSTDIQVADCGCVNGLVINKKDLAVFVDDESPEAIKASVSKIFAHTIVGRYRVGTNKIITEQEAARWASDDSFESIEIRSPLTCLKPCCTKCYGIEWSTHAPAVVGTPVGIIAAQSIGEPGTQLTLKQFQKGGVAGKAEVTSAFDKVDKYIHVSDLAEANKNNKYPGYDPIAWATGKVIEKASSNLNEKIVTIEGDKKSIKVPKDVILKQDAVKGEGLSYRHGDYNLRELLEYTDIRTAQKYLMFKLYALYQSEVKIKMVHFECLVANMTRYMIVETDRKDLMVGQYATAKELYAGSVSNTRFIPRLIGVKDLTNASHDALDAIIMEDPVEGLSRICLLEMTDKLEKPINRMLLGLTINNGSNTPGYTKERMLPI